MFTPLYVCEFVVRRIVNYFMFDAYIVHVADMNVLIMHTRSHIASRQHCRSGRIFTYNIIYFIPVHDMIIRCSAVLSYFRLDKTQFMQEHKCNRCYQIMLSNYQTIKCRTCHKTQRCRIPSQHGPWNTAVTMPRLIRNVYS